MVKPSFATYCLLTFLISDCLINGLAIDIDGPNGGQAALFSRSDPMGRECLPTDEIAVAEFDLTEEERSMLDFICWQNQSMLTLPTERKLDPLVTVRDGIPAGISCSPTQWCDGSGACTVVCDRGSVNIEPWLVHAVKLQAKLARGLPFCFTTLFGTHNSAITLADGYGNLDLAWQSLFKYIKWVVPDAQKRVLRTNNQWLSITDQLNLGVRAVEIDTHWVGNVLRIAHCGGLHVEALNLLVRALNTVAKLLGHDIRWDTETMGCNPSLSSIPALEQRTLVDALTEIRGWMNAEENKDEFLVLYFDDQPDLSTWGVVSKLKEDVLSVFPEGEIFTQEDLKLTNGEWPSLEEMLKEGHRLLLVSATDYGKAMAPLIFPRGKAVCRWEEPSLNAVRGVPQCTLLDRKKQHKGIFNGELMRVSTCELEYGPLNCDFIWDQGNAPFFDESTLPDVIDCGLNLPAPDLLTPSRAAASVWTWAPGHPQKNVGECAMISASDGRWRSMPCDTADVLPSTCRKRDVPITNDNQWVINVSSTLQDRGSCPEGSYFDMPRHARENYHLAMSLLHAGVAGAWLPAGSRLNIV